MNPTGWHVEMPGMKNNSGYYGGCAMIISPNLFYSLIMVSLCLCL